MNSQYTFNFNNKGFDSAVGYLQSVDAWQQFEQAKQRYTKRAIIQYANYHIQSHDINGKYVGMRYSTFG